MKLAIGMITRDIDTNGALLKFLENAERYGHKIDCVIAAHSERFDPHNANIINQKAPLHAIDIHRPDFCAERLKHMGISSRAARTLLECPVSPDCGLVPYGFNRNLVVMEAILRGVDILLFVDSDVVPEVLSVDEGSPSLHDTDFFGAHLEQFYAGARITTAEYSGYNILPPASFEGMDDLLLGLQKDSQIEYWRESAWHRCLMPQTPVRNPEPCTKILGGNTGIDLSVFSALPPFFSSYYTVGDELFLSRGEDTLLGLAIAQTETPCTDIQLNPLHDTYNSFPEEPDLIHDPAVQERFYYACTGWLGRNPLYSYFQGKDIAAVRSFQREHLEKGLHALSEYTSNPRFLGILDNFDASWDRLERFKDEFEHVGEAWREFTRAALWPQ